MTWGAWGSPDTLSGWEIVMLGSHGSDTDSLRNLAAGSLHCGVHRGWHSNLPVCGKGQGPTTYRLLLKLRTLSLWSSIARPLDLPPCPVCFSAGTENSEFFWTQFPQPPPSTAKVVICWVES
jgi:hypothetical protein